MHTVPIINYFILGVLILALFTFINIRWGNIEKCIDSSDASPSSKRFIGVMDFFVLIITIWIIIFLDLDIPKIMPLVEVMKFIIVTTVIAGSGEKITTAIFSKKDTPVATDPKLNEAS